MSNPVPPRDKESWVRRLHQACDAAGIKSGRGRQTEICSRGGFQKSLVNAWFNGRSKASGPHAAKLARLLNVRVEWLHDGVGPMEETGNPDPDTLAKVVAATIAAYRESGEPDPEPAKIGRTVAIIYPMAVRDPQWADSQRILSALVIGAELVAPPPA